MLQSKAAARNKPTQSLVKKLYSQNQLPKIITTKYQGMKTEVHSAAYAAGNMPAAPFSQNVSARPKPQLKTDVVQAVASKPNAVTPKTVPAMTTTITGNKSLSIQRVAENNSNGNNSNEFEQGNESESDSGENATLANDEEGENSIWSSDVEKAFEDAMTIYPSVGRRKICIDGSMYGRNELIARHIKLVTGKVRTRKQVSSHIQARAKKTVKYSGNGTQGMSSTEILASVISQGRGPNDTFEGNQNASPSQDPEQNKPRSRFEAIRSSPVLKSPKSRVPPHTRSGSPSEHSPARRALLIGRNSVDHGSNPSSSVRKSSSKRQRLTKGEHDAAHILGLLQASASASKRARLTSDEGSQYVSDSSNSTGISETELIHDTDIENEAPHNSMIPQQNQRQAEVMMFQPVRSLKQGLLCETQPGFQTNVGPGLEKPPVLLLQTANNIPASTAVSTFRTQLIPGTSVSSGTPNTKSRLTTPSREEASALLAFAKSPGPVWDASQQARFHDMEARIKKLESEKVSLQQQFQKEKTCRERLDKLLKRVDAPFAKIGLACVRCQTSADHCISPCGHVLCGECAEKRIECPYCYADVEKILQLRCVEVVAPAQSPQTPTLCHE
eukprot:m.7032 g.7032  ORF g.7032 m.7032 type:complete len:614 (-) comp3635_c0_seq2:207-2048(-)